MTAHHRVEHAPPAAVATPWPPPADAPSAQGTPQALGRHPVPSLSPLESGFPHPRPEPRERPAPQQQRGSSARTRRRDDRSQRPLVARRQRRTVVHPEPFDQDPELKLARSVPRASLPPQGKPLNWNQNTATPSSGTTDYTAPLHGAKPKPDDERDNSARF